jgi:ribosome-binding factor A
MQPIRQQRVSELLKRQLGEIIRREIPVDEAGVITVNDVEVAGDLQSAKVFVGVIGNPQQKKRAVERLESDRKHLQGLLARAVVLRYTPLLTFVLDESVERGNRILAIIEDLEKSSPKP